MMQEKTNVKKQHRELKKNHVTLNKSKKDKELKIQELTSRALDVQMLKFGRTIDLEKLEKLGVNRNAEELKEKITREEAKRSAELAQWDSKIARLKEDLTSVTKENTVRLQALGDLVENRKKLEDTLNYNQATVTAEYSGPQKKDVVERDKLIKLVQNQSGEIEELKNEIEFLIRKPIRQGGQTQAPKSFKTDLTASMSASPDIMSQAVKESLGHLQGTAKAAEPRPPSEPRISLPRPGQEVSTPPAAVQQGDEAVSTN